MILIKDTLVSLDLIERYFHCDLDSCHGECCIEGDAGAPVDEDERTKLIEIVPIVRNDLTPAAQRVIDEEGPVYVDEEGDLVTSIVGGRDCVFTTYGKNGLCLCAIEKAWREGRTDFRKPRSCHLYPVRVKKMPTGMTAVNLHRWKICRCAETLGRAKGVRAYEFLAEPLIERFGREWYDELCLVAREWLKTQREEEPRD